MILILTMVMGACATGESAASDATITENTVATADTAAEDVAAPEAEGETVSFDTPQGRKVIQTASISIEADDTRAAMNAIRELVDEAEGFIQSATVADPVRGEDQPRIDLVVRIPATDLSGALDSIAALASRVVTQSQRGKDVTEEYVDVEARIENLSALETELRALLAEVREHPEADPEKLLKVFNEISRVRGEIEQLQGRRQVLDDLTTLATLEVKIAPTPAAAPVVEEGWAPVGVLKQSIQSLVGALQELADLAIQAIVVALPLLLLVVGLPLYIGRAVWRRFGHHIRTVETSAD